ncbi:hypothetical protein Tsubulata_029200 [Turnera subulata]|uniref:Homeobox domain-containing protein n=1 Tax=Turnera subulata TaxID=218843 RepID=A0A9Q0JLF2_9ROSI|nr:hypothetical protein Tsubulata_029200 [Turnera subulata]
MATYFDGNQEIQAAVSSAQGLQTLVLMNPTTYVQYSDTPPPQPPSNNLLFLNSSATSLSHAPSNTQQFVGIPLDPTSAEASTLHGLIHYNLYNPISNDPDARDTPRAQQALSLTLSSHQHQHRHRQHEYGSQDQSSDVSGEEDIRVVSAGGGGSSVLSSVSGQLQGGGLLSSKYLKAAQELLDEVVTVKSHDHQLSTKSKSNISTTQVVGGGEAEDGKRGPEELTTPERQEIQMKKAKLINMLDQVEQRYRQYHHQMQIVISLFEEAAGIRSAKTYTALALQTISKQFRCLKDAITAQIKTTNKSLGEEDIGIGPTGGAGKVEAASSSSRLKFVDHQLRQQRALQHLGMMQHHNAWRPQRGLPERSVSVLRAWLFENFLHPYPKDSDKHMLAKQTGLTRSQVSNWFINARVRLWKPMVEEMYLEEIKEQELNTNNNSNNGSEDNKSKSSEQNKDSTENQTKSFKSLESSPNHQNGSSISTTSPMAGAGIVGNHPGFSLMAELEGMTQASPKKPRGTDFMHSPTTTTATTTITTGVSGINKDDDNMSMKFSNERGDRDGGYSFMGGQTNLINGGFGEYPIGEIARYNGEQSFTPSFSGNGVSLSLGLPHCENLSLSSPAAPHQSFLPNQNNNNNIQLGRRVDIGHSNDFGAIPTTSVPHSSSSTPYDSINIQNRKRFAAQLLPDFVA